MKTATIKFKANNKQYTITFPCEDTTQMFKSIKAIYAEYNVKKATCQMLTFPNWNFWCSYSI